MGAVLRFGCKVDGIACNDVRPSVRLESGELIEADVIVGADGELQPPPPRRGMSC